VARKRPTKKHAVKAELRVHGLSKAGSSLNLKIYASKLKLGEVTVGRGSLYWYGRYRQRRKRISWTRFAEMMDQLAYGK
jgi:tRNA U54 and U55 pseudouridine synthase Pus10